MAGAAVGAVAFAGMAAWVSTTDGADAAASTIASLTTADAVASRARIPLGGGPEFASLNDYPICGEPTPLGRSSERGFSIAAAVGPSEDPWSGGSVDSLTVSVTFGDGYPGPVARGPLWVMLVKGGKIAGAARIGAAQLRAAIVPHTDPAELALPAMSDVFACRRLSLRGPREYDLFPVEPGDYTAVASARIFATQESVALGQVLPGGFRIDEAVKQPGGVYRPGSYDCIVLEAGGQVVRGCLPDVVPGALVDTTSQTVSVRYDATEYAGPLDVTLVSQPLNLTLTSLADNPREAVHVDPDAAEPTRFVSAADVVCGAVVSDYTAFESPGQSRFDTDTGRDDVSIDARLTARGRPSAGIVQARVMPWLAPDGALVRLDAGARVVYLRYLSPGTQAAGPAYEVVGFAPVQMLGGIAYDRYAGPTGVRLRVGQPEPCPGIDDGGLVTGDTAVLGTWTVTSAGGPQATHERISTTGAWLPSRGRTPLGG